MDEKKTDKERLKEITAGIETGIRELFQSDKYMNYLSVMSRFHRYSVNNQMLIYMQRPDATHVAGFNKWKNQFSRNVKKGERGIKIIAPVPYNKTIETDKLDPDTKLPLRDTEGKPIREEKTIKVPYFKVTSVFDLAQTEGKPLPELASKLTGDVKNYDVFMEALKRSATVPVVFEAMTDNMDGYFSLKDQRIAIREGMSEVQTVCASIHEIAHSMLHNKDEIGERYESIELFDKPALFSNGRVDRDKLPEGLYSYDLRGSDDDPGLPIALEEHVVVNHAASVITAEPVELPEDGRLFLGEDGLNFTGTFQTVKEFHHTAFPEKAKMSHATEELQAESISFAVCAYYGIETGDNSFGYLATYAKDKEMTELRENLETINKTSSALITDIDRNYTEIMKERGLDKVQEEVKKEEIVPDKTVSVEKMNEYGYTGEDMLPLSKEKAQELYEKDVSLYMLQPSGKAELVFDIADISDHSGLFGIEKAEWEMEKHRIMPEAVFNNIGDKGFMICQIRDEPGNAKHMFLAYDPTSFEPRRYEAVYADKLDLISDKTQTLENIYTKFNIDRPENFRGHSLSVSDIVVLKQDGEVSSHYVDSVGFKEIADFLTPENYLKNAELQLEDDADMIDGILNNGKKLEEPQKIIGKKSHYEMER